VIPVSKGGGPVGLTEKWKEEAITGKDFYKDFEADFM